jgi:hypothetical protein
MERRNINLDLLSSYGNLKEYLAHVESNLPTHKITYLKLNDDYYIKGNGNHRTVVAKYFFYFNSELINHDDLYMINGVNVYEYHIITSR